ncbi:MAG TPA: DUF885 domain-containing protein, partial [Thermoanaerobaculia bacterium]|nr:DUF885 domain-containing protein [Thermoanaerobaculia bacterium]
MRPTTCLHAASLVLATALTACAGTRVIQTTTVPPPPPPAEPAEAAVPAPAAPDPAAAATAVDGLADRYVAAYFEHFPDAATGEGIAGADHGRLPDNSLAGLAAWHAVEDELLAELRAVDAAALPTEARLTHDFLADLLESAIGRRICHIPLWEVSPTWTGWQSRYAYLASIQPVGTAEERQMAVARFRELPRFLDQEVDRLREGVRLGYTAPRVNVARVIEQMDSLLALPLADSPFYQPAVRAEDEAFAAELAPVVEDQVQPAIRRYRDYLADEYLPAAREDIAVAANPEGAACYRAAVRYHTSVQMSPEEIHRLGQEQMEILLAQMREIGERSFATADPEQLLERVGEPPYTFSSRQEMVDYARAAVARAEAAIPEWFGIVPTAEVVVVPYPEFRERSAPGGEYSAASDAGDRPGTYYINTYRPETQSKAGVEATAFHEAYPGHHLQISIAKERQDTHPIQRYFGTSGFSEGWALYTERLAEEMELYSGDVDLLGLLSNEALRAARLVVDSGMHALGWSREQALDYLLDHTAESRDLAAAEIDRYIAVPGQATAYMIGNLEIRRLR